MTGSPKKAMDTFEGVYLKREGRETVSQCRSETVGNFTFYMVLESK